MIIEQWLSVFKAVHFGFHNPYAHYKFEHEHMSNNIHGDHMIVLYQTVAAHI